MKPLDSLALLLALAPAESVSPLEKDSIKNNIELLGYPDSTSFSDSISSRQTSTVVMPGEILQKDRGTFRATELYWSEKDKEVYFKGKVRVNFRDQQFSGKGSFTILGKVDFLVIDGQPARQGKLIKLEASDYRLSILDSSEAAGKYGEKAQQGAVEIVRVKQE